MIITSEMILFASIFLVVGYLFGSFPTGVFVGKKGGHDLQSEGSGNIGTTNALRTMGKRAALITFLGDLAKAFIPTLCVRFIYCGCVKGYDADLTYLFTLITGLGVFLGHIFPFYLKFKGGKGIAVSAAIIIASSADLGIGMWMIFIGIALFAAIVAITKYVSLGSLVVMWYFPIYVYLKFIESPYFWIMMVVALIFVSLIYIKHAGNIKRLVTGTESKVSFKK
ncbi:MAG: glycerol-3-phosphate 1-O-acyltransferase PlsY [Eubacterium sp.]|nr:glycerol-3-phosphate 1-O-acyltransferase PlsY [Eubacterium sp.]